MYSMLSNSFPRLENNWVPLTSKWWAVPEIIEHKAFAATARSKTADGFTKSEQYIVKSSTTEKSYKKTPQRNSQVIDKKV